MPKAAKRPKKEPVKAKLKRLEKLARATARLSTEIFRDLVAVNSVPVPPKPKKNAKGLVAKSSVPVPPKPKFEALADLAYGAGVIEQGASDLAAE